jgi:hypothetical protein
MCQHIVERALISFQSGIVGLDNVDIPHNDKMLADFKTQIVKPTLQGANRLIQREIHKRGDYDGHPGTYTHEDRKVAAMSLPDNASWQ